MECEHYADSAGDRQMDASSKLTNIVDQSDPLPFMKVVKLCGFFKTNFRNDIFLNRPNTQASSRLVIVVEQIEH